LAVRPRPPWLVRRRCAGGREQLLRQVSRLLLLGGFFLGRLATVALRWPTLAVKELLASVHFPLPEFFKALSAGEHVAMADSALALSN